MHRLTSGIALMFAAASATAGAQSVDRTPGPFSFSLAAGPTRSFRGVDAPGAQGTGGIGYNLGRAFGVVLEGTGHWYETQPLYPCIIQDAGRCYQTIRRALAAGNLSVTYHMSGFGTDGGAALGFSPRRECITSTTISERHGLRTTISCGHSHWVFVSDFYCIINSL